MRSDLDAAYRAADYVVETMRGMVTLHIDEPCRALDQILAEWGVSTWAFITAHNPGSVLLSPAENADAHAKLLSAIEARGLAYLGGHSVGPGWPAESSLLILDIEFADAISIARHFGQSAIVAGEIGQLARLCWTD